jgi:hypothetical protein
VLIRVVVLSMTAVLMLGDGVASADCCMGPPISVVMPDDAPLAAQMKATVVNDDPDSHAGGDIAATLSVAGRRVVDLAQVHVADVSTVAQAVTYTLTAAQLAAVRAAGKRAHTTRGIVHFVISNAISRPNGSAAAPYTEATSISLVPGVHTSGPTKLSMARVGVRGVARRLRGYATVTAPFAWLRNSVSGAGVAAFGPIALDTACNAYLRVFGVALAVRDIRGYVDAAGGPGATVASGQRGTTRWRVRADSATNTFAGATAIGITRLAPHRTATRACASTFDSTPAALPPRLSTAS